jgi:hypothetical protein
MHLFMKLYTKSFNNKRDLVTFINDSGISKDDILSVFNEDDGLYTLMWYAEQ